MQCDPQTGTCLVPDSHSDAAATHTAYPGIAVRYVGDPMCSWCWGISPALKALEDFCAAEGIEFSVVVGGLRVGGGDPWTAQFKAFLRQEWAHISEVTGQPIGFHLLDAEEFNYDTEPACRAVVSVQLLQAQQQLPPASVLQFFTAVQRKFYVEGADPRFSEFYAEPCAEVGLDFAEFRALFESVQAKHATADVFAQRHAWQVRSFPTLLLEHHGQRTTLSSGFVTADQVLTTLQHQLALHAAPSAHA